MTPWLGVGLCTQLPTQCWNLVSLRLACMGLGQVIATPGHSYVELSCRVQKIFPCSHPPILALTFFLPLHLHWSLSLAREESLAYMFFLELSVLQALFSAPWPAVGHSINHCPPPFWGKVLLVPSVSSSCLILFVPGIKRCASPHPVQHRLFNSSHQKVQISPIVQGYKPAITHVHWCVSSP